MTDPRISTTVGIVEWSRRARASRAIEMTAADALGRAVSTTDDIALRLALVGRARGHAWRAAQWELVVPVLHDVDDASVTAVDDATVSDALARVRAASESLLRDDAELTDAVVVMWQQWLGEATAVADAPYMHVLRRVARDAADVSER